jgi:signal transduction histidine kinase
MLHEFLVANTQEITARARAKVAARTSPAPVDVDMRNGVPLFLSQLIDRLRSTTTDSTVIGESAALHGGELLAMGFSVSQVVHGYGDVCQVVTEMAGETDAPITPHEFHVFNRCLDDAIAHAVTEYTRQRDESVAHGATVHLTALVREMRSRLSAAMLSFTILQEGTVSIGGSTGAVLGRSLRTLRDLMDTALAGMGSKAGLGQRRRIPMSQLVADVELEAAMGAEAGAFTLTVSPVARGIDVDADPQILTAAIGNVLHNALKFGRPRGHVALRTTATADRVTIEIEDECGGLPPGKVEDLLQLLGAPSAAGAGLGPGLSISRDSVDALGGTISVRDLPGKGCVFSIELPRMPAA